jgi:hypothetical protein
MIMACAPTLAELLTGHSIVNWLSLLNAFAMLFLLFLFFSSAGGKR